MRRTLEPAELAGVEISELHDLTSMRLASALFADVWGTSDGEDQVSKDLLRAMVHAGNYAAGAYSGDEMVGAVMGFLGRDDTGIYLHSHILGVSAAKRGGNVGFALKQHQRAWALARGITKITWTFDPLVGRNAYFNFQKLGARAEAYYESFYGEMSDPINAGDESDRLLVVWDLEGERAELAASGRLAEPDDSADGVLVYATPDDIVGLRSSDPVEALRRRHALREELGRAMNDGYHIAGFTRTGRYVLVRTR